MNTIQEAKPSVAHLSKSARPPMTTKTLTPFLLITFILTWGLAALLFIFYDQIVAIFGEINASNPLYILAVYSPGIAGVLLVLYHYGFKGLGSFMRRLILWRAPRLWWLFLVLGIPVFFYVGAAIKGTLNDPFLFSPWYQVLPALVMALFLGPIEEFGWRGLALPLLQRKFSPFWAGLILGLIWAAWHIPSFMMAGTPQSNWSFVPFFAGVVALSVILTPLFNASKRQLVDLCPLSFQMMNPIWPDAQPWDSLLIIIAAVVIVWVNRRNMFSRENTVTEVLMPTVTSGQSS